MDELEIPQYFICPISLEIMKDPVTASTGITYDRESIERWLLTSRKTCPLTKQPLPDDSDLTPNHILRRLIQGWCNINSFNGIDRVPTPKYSLNKTHVLKLLCDLRVASMFVSTLKELEELATASERNRTCMKEVDVGNTMVLLIIRCYKEGNSIGLEEMLRILHLVWKPNPNPNPNPNPYPNSDFLDSLTWVLRNEMENRISIKNHATILLKMVIEIMNEDFLQNLNIEFFETLIKLFRLKISQQALKSSLNVLIKVSQWGRNRMAISECGGVYELIELELQKPEKHITELIFTLLANLCSCADGRAQFLQHMAGIAMVSKRILRVSPATDDRGIQILWFISQFSATDGVVVEMLKVGAVSKLCMAMQADCGKYLKDRVRKILKLHSNVWNNSPCIDTYLSTYPR